jgi:hypothetical protein
MTLNPRPLPSLKGASPEVIRVIRDKAKCEMVLARLEGKACLLDCVDSVKALQPITAARFLCASFLWAVAYVTASRVLDHSVIHLVGDNATE